MMTRKSDELLVTKPHAMMHRVLLIEYRDVVMGVAMGVAMDVVMGVAMDVVMGVAMDVVMDTSWSCSSSPWSCSSSPWSCSSSPWSCRCCEQYPAPFGFYTVVAKLTTRAKLNTGPWVRVHFCTRTQAKLKLRTRAKLKLRTRVLLGIWSAQASLKLSDTAKLYSGDLKCHSNPAAATTGVYRDARQDTRPSEGSLEK